MKKFLILVGILFLIFCGFIVYDTYSVLPMLDIEDDRVNIDKIIRLILRNYLGARLRNKKSKLLIEFGWDFYMYVQCELKEKRLREIVEKEGLYLDPR